MRVLGPKRVTVGRFTSISGCVGKPGSEDGNAFPVPGNMAKRPADVDRQNGKLSSSFAQPILPLSYFGGKSEVS